MAADFVSKRRQQLQANGETILPKANCEPQKFIREFRLTAADHHRRGRPDRRRGVQGSAFRRCHRHQQGPWLYRRHETAQFPGSARLSRRKKVHRQQGSIGSHASNRGFGRPKLGHKKAGQYGNARITVRNLHVVKIDAENNLMLVRGAVPGPNGGLVTVRPTNKKAGVGPPKEVKKDVKKKK